MTSTASGRKLRTSAMRSISSRGAIRLMQEDGSNPMRAGQWSSLKTDPSMRGTAARSSGSASVAAGPACIRLVPGLWRGGGRASVAPVCPDGDRGRSPTVHLGSLQATLCTPGPQASRFSDLRTLTPFPHSAWRWGAWLFISSFRPE